MPFSGTKGPRVTSAMELMAKQWTDFGAKVTTKPIQHATLDAILASDAWDIICDRAHRTRRRRSRS
ncbi:hypothetical protein [Spongiactinospora gelatinilytica]|uniref:hypothetical protein n=1 Tax=Spongiactinospora gelatinilytica TaxID=2666298 RepID=UPI0011B94521|nr:hypothetical protein [Spongiactinospora gelatinilytica]